MKKKSILKVKFSHQDQARWFLLLSDLLRVGFSLRHALTFTQTSLPKIGPLLNQVEKRVSAGESLSKSLASYVQIDTYYQLSLAEQHGDLTKVLKELGTLMMTREKQRRKLRGLLQYPLILLLILGLIIAGLILFVYPELKTWQPLSQQVYVNYLIDGGIFILTTIACLGLWWYLHWRNSSRLQKVTLFCRLPVIGKCYETYFGYYLMTNLAILLQSGLSLQEINQITEKFDHDSLLYQFGQVTNQFIQTGVGLESVVAKYEFVPNELVIFINKGTSIKELGDDLAAFAEILFQKLTNRVEQLLVWVQPLVFLLIAVTIIILYLSILLPIYHSMTEVF